MERPDEGIGGMKANWALGVFVGAAIMAAALLAARIVVAYLTEYGSQRIVIAAAIEKMEGVQVHVLPTPEAFALFNRCVAEGRKVVLIAHSTC